MARLQKVKEVFMLFTAGDGKQLKLHVWEKNARKGFLKKGQVHFFCLQLARQFDFQPKLRSRVPDAL